MCVTKSPVFPSRQCARTVARRFECEAPPVLGATKNSALAKGDRPATHVLLSMYMCGRHTLTIDKSTIEKRFGAKFYVAKAS